MNLNAAVLGRYVMFAVHASKVGALLMHCSAGSGSQIPPYTERELFPNLVE